MADKVVRLRDGYEDEQIVVWMHGNFATPLCILNVVEAEKLRDELTAALNRKLPKKRRQ